MFKRALATALTIAAVTAPVGSADAARAVCDPVCEVVCAVVSSGCDIGILCINEPPVIVWCAWGQPPTILPADTLQG